jgi:DNA-binding beta-propeller fold protein YncE
MALIVLLTNGCASKWALRTEKSEIELQWPYQPDRAKVTYVMSLKGFERSSSSQSVFNAIVYGKSGDDDSLSQPVAVAVGRDGRIAIADRDCNCVHLYLPGEEYYRRLSNTDTETFMSPVSVIFDDDLKLYVSDSVAGKLFVFSREGAFLFALQKAGSDYLKRPTGLAYNSRLKLLYVVDTLGNKVYAFNSEGEVVFSFGTRGEGRGQFNLPTHIFWSPAGSVYVTDAMNFRIEIFDESGVFLGSFGRHGDGSGDLARPKGVAADKDGNIYVVDSLMDNIQLFDREGKFLLTVGKRGSDFAEFWLPSGMFIDGRGTLYICDTYNRRVQIFRITENYADEKF